MLSGPGSCPFVPRELAAPGHCFSDGRKQKTVYSPRPYCFRQQTAAAVAVPPPREATKGGTVPLKRPWASMIRAIGADFSFRDRLKKSEKTGLRRLRQFQMFTGCVREQAPSEDDFLECWKTVRWREERLQRPLDGTGAGGAGATKTKPTKNRPQQDLLEGVQKARWCEVRTKARNAETAKATQSDGLRRGAGTNAHVGRGWPTPTIQSNRVNSGDRN